MRAKYTPCGVFKEQHKTKNENIPDVPKEFHRSQITRAYKLKKKKERERRNKREQKETIEVAIEPRRGGGDEGNLFFCRVGNL